MAENVGALILPIGADPSQFKQSINDVKAAFKQLSNTIASTPFNLVTDKQKLELNALKETLAILTADVKEFGNEFKVPENSILGLKKRIEQLNNEKIRLDPTESKEKIERLNQEIERLEGNLREVDNLGKQGGKAGAGYSNGMDKITESSKKSRIAITNLTLVAQDLPFGFIAIQNNLPNLLNSLGQLDTKTNGVKGALKDLGGQLIGPAGLFLAFSAVTAAVTYAIKEYGSLSNALNVLFGANGNAIKSQNAFNKSLVDASSSTAAEVAEIKILVKTIQDENTSQADRLAAYRKVKEIRPDVVAGVDELNLATATSIELIGKNATAELELIKLQARRSAIGSTLEDLEKRRFQANGKLNKAKQDQLDYENKLDKIEEKRAKKGVVGKVLGLSEKQFNALAENQAAGLQKNIELARKEIIEIDKDQKNWANSLEPTIKKIAELSSASEDLANKLKAQRKAEGDAAKETERSSKSYEKSSQKRLDALNKFNQLKIELPKFNDNKSIDNQISSLEKYGNILLDTTKYDFERAAALKEVIEIDKDFAKNLDGTKNILQSIQGEIQSYIGYLYNLREIQKVLAKDINISKVSKEIETQIFIDTSKLKSEIPALLEAAFPDEEFKRISEAWAKINEETAPELDKFKQNIINSLLSKEISGAVVTYENISDAVIAAIKNIKNELETLQINEGIIDILNKGLNVEETYNKAIEKLLKFGEFTKNAADGIAKNLRFLQEPLEGLFTTILEKGKSSWKSFADEVIKQVKRIAASLVSKALIKGISFLISLLSGGATGVVTAGLKGISTDVLGEFLGERVKVDFGGIQGGGMQMSGQVVFVQRGSDLVGVLNRTNGTINRVG
jgi:hypothetical protein